MCLFVPSFPSLGWIQNFARSMRGPKCVLEMWPGEKTRETPHGFAKTSQPSCPGKDDPIKSATCWRVVEMPSMMRRNHPGHSVGPAPPGKVSELQRWNNQKGAGGLVLAQGRCTSETVIPSFTPYVTLFSNVYFEKFLLWICWLCSSEPGVSGYVEAGGALGTWAHWPGHAADPAAHLCAQIWISKTSL